jgi:RNA polymerase sigma-70 factor (ECF subfamily)
MHHQPGMLSRLAAVATEGAGTAEPHERVRTLTSGARFDEVYREHAAFVWRVLRGMGIAEAGVEDALQDVFVVVHRRLPEFDGRHSVRTWLFEIAYRVASEHRRKAKRTSAHAALPDDVQDAAPGPAQSVEQRQALALLSELLDQLSDEQRIVLVLTEIEGMTAPEIAEATGVTLNTVYTRLRRARIALDGALAQRRRRGP